MTDRWERRPARCPCRHGAPGPLACCDPGGVLGPIQLIARAAHLIDVCQVKEGPEVAMLSHEEHRRLVAIERQLAIDDPVLARRFARHRSARGQARRVAAAVLATIYALATIVAFLPAFTMITVVLAASTAVAVCFVIRKAWQRFE